MSSWVVFFFFFDAYSFSIRRRVWMAAGILCMLCGPFGESTAALVVYVGIIAVAAIVSVLYSYLFYKKKVTKL